MDITRDQQIALDDSLVAPANRLKIGKAFQITKYVPEIYMQEFWDTTKICPKLPNHQFEELPIEETILTFLRDLGHSGEIKVITDINVNKLHQPWRSFATVINKCLSGKRSGYQQKDRKPSQNDKTEHGMEKTVQNQGQSPDTKVRVN
ncbi:hypothetical protein Tco_1069258 [Tanacetum coccineum]|uniref:Uncharacterized protein n=1 Tax=Tanacetum coccineum TaxID=301880 RepID=A0ABQ5HI28_9ASTR